MAVIALLLACTGCAPAAPTAVLPTTAAPPSAPAARQASRLVIAVVGDYGCMPRSDCKGAATAAGHEMAVASLIQSWNPDAIVTVGDDSYDTGIPQSVAADQAPYRAFIDAGRFYPALGNHDWAAGSDGPSLAAFGRPAFYVAHLGGGLLDVFVADTNPQDPAGDSATSLQAIQFRAELAASISVWKITANHQAQYASGHEGSYAEYRWLSAPGIDLSLAGHDHDFEHLVENGRSYVVAGTGGEELLPMCQPTCITGSVWHDAGHYGAVRLTITPTRLTCDFIAVGGITEHSFTLLRDMGG